MTCPSYVNYFTSLTAIYCLASTEASTARIYLCMNMFLHGIHSVLESHCEFDWRSTFVKAQSSDQGAPDMCFYGQNFGSRPKEVYLMEDSWFVWQVVELGKFEIHTWYTACLKVKLNHHDFTSVPMRRLWTFSDFICYVSWSILERPALPSCA